MYVLLFGIRIFRIFSIRCCSFLYIHIRFIFFMLYNMAQIIIFEISMLI